MANELSPYWENMTLAVGKTHRRWYCTVEDRRFPFSSNLKIFIKYLDEDDRKLDPSAWTTVLIDNAETLPKAIDKLVAFADWLGMTIFENGLMEPRNSAEYWVAQ